MGAADVAIAFALAQRGKPYVFGATGPDSYDCSGLVQAAYRAAGITLPRTTYQQILVGVPVARSDLQPGDLVFPSIEHVQLYIGNDQVVEAPHSGSDVHTSAIWGFYAARRVTAPGNVVNPGSPQTTPAGLQTVGLTDGIAAMVKDALTMLGWGAMVFGGSTLMLLGGLVLAAHTQLGGQAMRTATKTYTRGLIDPKPPAKRASPPRPERDDQAPDDEGYQPRHARGVGRRRRYQVTDEQTGESVFAYGRSDVNARRAQARDAGRRVRVERV